MLGLGSGTGLGLRLAVRGLGLHGQNGKRAECQMLVGQMPKEVRAEIKQKIN